MQTVTLDKKYSIPTSWRDLTLDDLTAWLNFAHDDEDPAAVLASLAFRTKIPEAVLQSCDVDALAMLAELTAFYYRLDELDAFNFVPKQFADAIDFGKLPYGKLVMIENAIKTCEKEGKHPFTISADLMRIYFEPQEFQRLDGFFGYAHYLWERASFYFKWDKSIEIIHNKKIHTIHGQVAFFLQNYESFPRSGNG